MPRKPRVHFPGALYHATMRGNHREDIFHRDCERALLNKIVARSLEKCCAQLHAYCWMSNHLHFLVQVGERPLSGLMQRIASEYARAFQSSLATTGHLFENRYFASLIDTDAYFLEAVRYVHQNPVRARIAQGAVHYRWSSHQVYLGNSVEPWVTTDFALAQFSGDRARAIVLYRAFIDATPAAEIAAELACLEQGSTILGKPEFVAQHTQSRSQVASLSSIIAMACHHFSVTDAELRSPVRTARLVTARAWIAHTAIRSGAASMAAIARELRRDESSLRSAIRSHADSLEGDHDLLTASKRTGE